MNEEEKRLAADILGIFARLPETRQHQLLGAAQGMDMMSGLPQRRKEDGDEASSAGADRQEETEEQEEAEA